MAENKEDLSTEQILSSIKSMLTDDGPVSSSDSHTQPEEDIAETLPENPSVSEDILELTAAMIVKDDEQTAQLAIEDEISTEPTEETLSADTIIDEPVAEGMSEEEISEEMDSANLSSTPLDTLVDTVIEETPEAEMEHSSGETIQADANILDVETSSINEMLTEESIELNMDSANLSSTSVEELEAVVEEKTEARDIKVEAPKAPLVNAEEIASNIIQNFSALFSKENLTKTTDLEPQVIDEVILQVKVWLDENVPSVINESVKKELERVMAKVDGAE